MANRDLTPWRMHGATPFGGDPFTSFRREMDLVKLLCGRAIAGALGTAAGLERTNPRLLGVVIPRLNLVAAVETGKVEIEADKLFSLVAGNSHGCPQHRLTCEHCLHGHLSGSS